jgi:hypothetical protein
MTDLSNQTLHTPLTPQELRQSLLNALSTEQEFIEEINEAELAAVVGAVNTPPGSPRVVTSAIHDIERALSSTSSLSTSPREVRCSSADAVTERMQGLKSFYTNHKPFVQKVSAASMYGTIGGALATTTKK